MKNDSLVIYKDVPVVVCVKAKHIRKIGGRVCEAFYLDYGDVPVCVLNDVTGQMMPVDNRRGTAYACRNRLRYRKKK